MQRKLRILIVEDESAIRTGLTDVFLFHGYEVNGAADGHRGLEMAMRGGYDMILLDVMLPGVNGFDICARIREHDREQPVIMLTAKTDDEDIIHGLALGADDYVSKPFSVAQLVLRVKAVLRRARPQAAERRHIRLGEDVEIDCLNLCGRRGTQSVNFTRREMEVLQYLDANRDRPVPREELLDKVWGYGSSLDIETRTVDIHIAKLRRKLEAVPAEPRHLVTVRGAGYRLLSD